MTNTLLVTKEKGASLEGHTGLLARAISAHTSFTAIILGLYFLAHLYVAPGSWAYGAFFAEDHLGEWLQFLVCLYTSYYCLRCALEFREPLLRGGAVLASLGMFFLAGEEISWGQRVFGLQSDYFFFNNYQGETNLHNLLPLESNLLPYYGASFLIGVIINGVGGVLASQRSQPWPWLDTLISAVVMAGLYASLPMEKHIYFYEYTELWIYGSLLLFAIRLKRVVKAEGKGRVRATI